jgi:adenosylcobinamide kinase/adenosylcobinamide-phosphate guanylyltransferase
LKKMILVLGGARSGKSRYAVEYARQFSGDVLFVATAIAGDHDMGRRIEKHKADRPAGWRTLEAAEHVGSQIEAHAAAAGLIIIDCITLLVNNVFSGFDEARFDAVDERLLETAVMTEIDPLLESLKRVKASVLIVSNEVGFGVVPETRMGRLYRDLLGKANQFIATRADEVYLLVAGIPLRVKPGNDLPA